MSDCTSSCKTKNHITYAECLRSNMPMIAPSANPSVTGWDMEQVKKDNRELDTYYSALNQGVEPISTKQKDIDAAMRLSNDTGVAFNGNAL